MYIDDNDAHQSEETKKLVDEQVRLLLTESHTRAKNILQLHRKELDIIANGLIQYESLSG
jgi:ATP-dependent Zn protease